MKLAILTQPLKNNYGCLLQAYSLQYVLRSLGCEPVTLDIALRDSNNHFWYLARSVRNFILRCFGKKVPFLPTPEQYIRISKNNKKFIEDNITVSDRITNRKQLNAIVTEFDGYIVGSDQVWRPCYSTDILLYYLDFIESMNSVKKIAYAASFGVEEWELSAQFTPRCASLAQKFDRVSVREDSGVRLCNNYLGVDALHVLDPVMLLSEESFVKLLDRESNSDGNLMVYVLDDSEQKRDLVKRVADIHGLKPFSVGPKKRFEDIGVFSDDCVIPPLGKWLKGFKDSHFVVTDSFHGTVLAILFNKPFIVIGNDKRGMTRFKSLLKLFKLEDRLLNCENKISDRLIVDKINFTEVNSKVEIERRKSIHFIKEALGCF